MDLVDDVTQGSPLLAETAPKLAKVLARSMILTPPRFAVSEIRCRTVMVAMRDGTRLATDLYLPPETPAPTIAMRTPYARAADLATHVFMTFARRGYAVVSQDCRGTGDSEPETWDYYIFEPDDGYDFVEWVSTQGWFDGFLGACGGSYVGQTQWHLAMHPATSTIVPEVSGLGVAVNTARHHMFQNAYARSFGKGDKVAVHPSEMERFFEAETMASGYFNEPLHQPFSAALLDRFPELRDLPPTRAKRWLWERYCALGCAERAELVKLATGAPAVDSMVLEGLPALFGHQTSPDTHTLPHPDPAELCASFHAPVLLRTGWYDWAVNDALATWELLRRAAPEPMRSQCRLVVTPTAHNAPGYHEGMAEHPELQHAHGFTTNVELLMRWYEAVRTSAVDSWPTVIYYLMGANEWRTADDWPVPGTRTVPVYLEAGGRLSPRPPHRDTAADSYVYDPDNPTPTVGGSIVSYLYTAGSADVREVQRRPDVLTYTTPPLHTDVDVVGPLRLVLYASSSAMDTDFVARLTDVHPDGRAIQLQSGILRARYRNLDGEPELLEPGHVYRFDIDMWATANRFSVGHRLRVDISSADFPLFDRNSNRGGEPGPPIRATQTIYRDAAHPSHLLLPVLGADPFQPTHSDD